MKNIPVIIKKKYLFFRNETNYLKRIIKERKSKIIYLDFSKVIFFSRSFADEFLNTIENLKKEKIIVKIKNLKPKLEFFLQQIKEKKEEIKEEVK